MRNILANSRRTIVWCFAILTVAGVLTAVPLLSRAHRLAAAITVANSSSREIHHLYLSPVDQNNWGPDQLNSAILINGQSITLSGFSCSGSEIKVIGEDKDGCFLSAVVSCSTDSTWTITNETAADCGD